MKKIAINGFGRIGRMVARALIEEGSMELVAVNDLTDTKTLAHLFKRDSIQPRFQGTVSHTEDAIIINGKEIKVYAEKEPAKLPWKKHAVDVVVESTGRFLTQETAKAHLKAGAKKVLLSAPAKDEDTVTLVKGVNEQIYNVNDHDIVSNASCTTNCFAPMVKVLHDNFKVKQGFMVTIHAYTADQRIVDGPHRDLRRARSAALNIIPTTSGAAKAVVRAIPELKGKLSASAVRVPVAVGSMTYFVGEVEGEPTAEKINALFKSVSEHHLNGVLEYSEDPLVSSDIIGNPHSTIFDSSLTEVNGNMVKIVGWYDNEWGYSHRMVDMLKLL